ncbi:hypothetical protein [Phormidium tenue]
MLLIFLWFPSILLSLSVIITFHTSRSASYRQTQKGMAALRAAIPF